MHLLEDVVTVLLRNKLAQIGISTDIFVCCRKLVIYLLLTTIIILTTVFIREALNVPPDWEICVQKAIHLRDIVHRKGGFQVTIFVPGLKWSCLRSITNFIWELPLANTLYNPTFGTRIGLGNIEVSWAHTCSSCTPPTTVGHNPCTFAKWWPWSSLHSSWPYVPSRCFSGSFRTI